MQPPEGIGLGIPQIATPKMQIHNISTPEYIVVWNSPNRNPHNANIQKALVSRFPETQPQNANTHNTTPRRHRKMTLNR